MNGKQDLKKTLVLLFMLTLVSVFLSGCGILSILRKAASANDHDTQEAQIQETGQPSEKPDASPEPEPSEEPAFPDGFPFTIIEHDAEFALNGVTLAEGVCHDIVLPGEVAAAFPKLAETVESINTDNRESVFSSLQGMEEDALEMRSYGGELVFSDWRFMEPVRADDRVFSIMTGSSLYLGGAHPYTAFSAVNIDPATGEKIPFSAVCKKTEGLDEICFDELLKQNEDLVEYFENTDEKSFVIDSLNERFRDGAEYLTWTLDYDGIRIYYDDYGMGTYAAGSREEKILFADYPDYFTTDYLREGTIPDITEQVTKETGEVLSVPRGDHVIDVYYLSNYRYEDVGNGYCIGILEAFDVSPEYQKLSDALQDSYAERNEQHEKDFADYVEGIRSIVENRPDDDGYQTYTYSDELALQRADTKVFSCFRNITRDTRGIHDERIITGMNFDTETGRELSLEDVITDKAQLLSALDVRLGEWDVNSDTSSAVREEFAECLSGNDLHSSEAFSWSLGYEGLTLYFNTSVNYNVFSAMGGTFSFFIPFREFPQLFVDEYTKVNYAYAQDLVIGEWPEYFSLDMDSDGYFDQYCINGICDEYGWYQSLSFGGKEQPYEEIENGSGTDLKSFLVRDRDGFYGIYIERGADDGYTMTDYYECYDNSLHYQSSFSGTMRYSLYDFGAEKPSFGRTLSTPVRMNVEKMNDMLGIHSVEGECHADYMGMPTFNGYLYFHPAGEGFYLETVKDLACDTVDDNDVLSEGTLKKGSHVEPFRYLVEEDPDAAGDDPKEAQLDVRAEDGTIYRLSVVRNAGSGIWEFGGKPLSDCFNGLPFY